MKNILISTIVRDRAAFLPMWIDQLNLICQSRKNINFYLSVYENDSFDASKNILQSLDYSLFKDVSIVCENIGTPSFGSIKHDLRVQLLAEARNKTLYNNDFLEKCDWVISVEPDIRYNLDDILKIIDDEDHDVLSARSIEKNNPEPNHLYDGWGTRNTSQHTDWDHSVNFDGLINVWTTYNCFCKYKAEPIKNKITFGAFNDRLNAFDCDTAVICENFRKNNYNKIALLGTVNVFHIR